MLALLPDVGGPELLLIFFLVLLLFGGKRLPELARGLGKSIREFKRATSGVEQELKRVLEDEPAERRARAEKKRLEAGETDGAAAIAATTAATTATAAAGTGETQEKNADAPPPDDYYDPTDDDFTTGEDADAAGHGYDDSSNPYPELRDGGTKAGANQGTGAEAEAAGPGADGQPEKKTSTPPSPETGDGGGI
ncbi:twin-arginine translocase TatA/TatE family subunit [Termitidicoccus mucosus]|uniref:Sec-independent protein translocase subunit TatA/TatB n=1 Tax=Termitidicoccus mucosus TaxID=1184151 RepID=UPI002FEE5953